MLINAHINFFSVEIANEREGGICPATLGSALDSLEQAPDDVIVIWCDDTVVYDQASVVDFITSVHNLIVKYGQQKQLQDLLDEQIPNTNK